MANRTQKHTRSPDYTVREAEEKLKTSIQTIRRLIKSGELHSYRFVERSTRIPSEEIVRLLYG